MAGFIRRYQAFPTVDTLTLIEGAIIVDLPPPGRIDGVGVGTVCLVGEFQDMSYATKDNGAGGMSRSYRPVEVFSGKDLTDKVGGFDTTLGNIGKTGGNGFISLRNKKFSRLVVLPINLASAKGVRLFRDLPTNKSATDPSPVVPMQAGGVSAGRQFKSGAWRVLVASRVGFLDTADYRHGVDGSVVAAGALASNVFTAAGGDFVNKGSVVGDILVLGVIGAAGAQGTNAATYRVVSVAAGGTQLTVEKLDGTAFTWATGGSLAWRLHTALCADSAVGINTNAAGYSIPARPLDHFIPAATVIPPTSVPAVGTATSWDPLSGLKMKVQAANALDYSAHQAPNAVNSSALNTEYLAALDSTISEELPAREINIVVCSRKSRGIAAKLKTHVADASAVGMGRCACVSPGLEDMGNVTYVLSEAAGTVTDATFGVGASDVGRDERLIYCWPGAKTSIPEAANLIMVTADGKTTTDGVLDTPSDEWMASVLSVLPPERNPGEATSYTSKVLGNILGLQRDAPTMGMNEYIALRKAGIAALRIDKRVGPVFQSGITTSLTSSQKNINRRRMADYIQDSWASRAIQFSKQPLTNQLKGNIVAEMTAFLDELVSETNPAAQRISGYLMDEKSGNTPDLEAKGIWVLIAKVRTLATADFLVLQTEVGEGVVVTAT